MIFSNDASQFRLFLSSSQPLNDYTAQSLQIKKPNKKPQQTPHIGISPLPSKTGESIDRRCIGFTEFYFCQEQPEKPKRVFKTAAYLVSLQANSLALLEITEGQIPKLVITKDYEHLRTLEYCL